MIDLTVELERDVSEAEINEAMQQAAEGPMRGILSYCTDPIVSGDVIGDSHSSVFDAGLTQVIDRRMAKVISWYDNEWGYSNRVVDLIERRATTA